MSDTTSPVIFDGHNDLLFRLHAAGGVKAAQTVVDGRDGAIDVDKARVGGFGGGFFAVYIASPQSATKTNNEVMSDGSYDVPLPDALDIKDAIPAAMSQIAVLFELERLGALKVVRTTDDLRSTLKSEKMAAILHLEGAECIDRDLNMLEVLFAAGLRSIGPVWSRPTIFGHGVPFRFPSTPDIGPGLTEDGIRLVKRCNELGVMLDLSHMNEAGFWDVAKHSTQPLVATHSNVYSLCKHPRNLTDKQLDAIKDSNGCVGLNFGVAFLRDDGLKNSDTKIDAMIRHLDYLIEKIGEDRVALGSDYDGTLVPNDLTTVADLPKLRQAMKQNGYCEELIRKICHENWIRVLDNTWKA